MKNPRRGNLVSPRYLPETKLLAVLNPLGSNDIQKDFLIAIREIAVRVIRGCHEMGTAVACLQRSDRASLHGASHG